MGAASTRQVNEWLFAKYFEQCPAGRECSPVGNPVLDSGVLSEPLQPLLAPVQGSPLGRSQALHFGVMGTSQAGCGVVPLGRP